MYYSNQSFKWKQNVKTVLDNTGNSHIWLNQGLGINSILHVHKLVK